MARGVKGAKPAVGVEDFWKRGQMKSTSSDMDIKMP
jgi:hypothetical protein